MRAVVLCAGVGSRLGPLTAERPKALLDVAGRPLVVRILEWLAGNGVGEVRINLHYLPEMIPAEVGDGSSLGLSVTYSYEESLLGSAGTVRAAREWIAGEDVTVVYGDVLCDEDLGPMVAQHRRLGSDGTLLLHRRAGSNSVVEMDEGRRIVSFLERPEPTAEPGGGSGREVWVNSGVQVLSPRLVDRIPATVPCDLPRDVYAPSVASLVLHGWPLTGSGWRWTHPSAWPWPTPSPPAGITRAAAAGRRRRVGSGGAAHVAAGTTGLPRRRPSARCSVADPVGQDGRRPGVQAAGQVELDGTTLVGVRTRTGEPAPVVSHRKELVRARCSTI